MTDNALIIDGHNYLFKGFYGVPTQAKRPDGTIINAVYGFFSLLRNILANIDPNYLVVAFDAETSIDQKTIVRPEYKAQRAPANGDVYSQLPLIKACLDILNIQWVDDKDNEADDLIGAYSSNFIEYGLSVNIGSNDYDFVQLVADSTFVLRIYHGAITTFDKPTVVKHFGITPSQYVDYLALKGDASDNIKGIQGIGKQRAASLLSEHKTITGIYQSFDSLPVGLQRLLHGKEKFLHNQRKFLKIKTDTNLCSVKSLQHHAFSKKMVPERMGAFLESSWDSATSRAQDYR
ncbi:5'-3' exonuclease [Patescibacteria group bacterium]|nr:5'-3' exonuclease [Patescibacteria group bacterium]